MFWAAAYRVTHPLGQSYFVNTSNVSPKLNPSGNVPVPLSNAGKKMKLSMKILTIILLLHGYQM